MKKLLIFIYILTIGMFLNGCGIFDKDVTVTSIEAYGDKTEFDESFQLSDIRVKIIKSDGTKEVVPLSSSMLSTEDLEKFQTPGLHNIKVKYLGAETTFEIRIVGEKGADGKEVELQVADGYIKWRYKGTSTWTNLISLSLLNGNDGNDGKDGEDGKEVELQIIEGFIKWRYKEDGSWIELIELSDLTGADGSNGKEIELQENNNVIEWRYKGDLNWFKLIDVDRLVGPKGNDGEELFLQVKDNFIQYKHKNDTEWINLISLDLIRGETGPVGPAGPPPIIEISEDGYWVFNGFKTTVKVHQTPEVQKFTITFDSNGGEMPEGYSNILESINQGSLIDLPIPTHDNLTFMGWYIGSEPYNSPFDEFDTVQKDMLLIAKWDYTTSNLEKFLNITNKKNYSLNYYRMQTEYNNLYEVFVNSSYYLDSNGNLNIHEFYKSKGSDYEEIYEDYYLITDRKYFDLYYYNDEWSYDCWDANEYNFNYLDLSYLDINKFVKHYNSYTYSYPINTELFYAIQENDLNDYGNIINYGKSFAYLDLKEMKFVVNIEIYIDDQIKQLYLEYHLYDTGSTFVQFPIDQVKTTIYDYLEGYMDNIDFEFATVDSKTEFLARLDEMKAVIANENDFEALFELQNNFSMELYDFNLIRDEVAYERSYYIDELRLFFNDISKLATDESILIMQEILDTAISNINTMTIIEGQSIYYFAKIDIEEAYVEDIDKVELDNYRFMVGASLSNLAETISVLLVNSEQIYHILDMYKSEFLDAKSRGEVDAIAMEIYERITSNELIYDEESFNEFKHNYYLDYNRFYNDGINGFPSYSVEINELYVEGVNAILDATNYIEVLDKRIYYINAIYPMILQYNKDVYLGKMVKPYNDKLTFAYDFDIVIIESIYNSFIELINNESEINKIEVLYNSYIIQLNSFLQDPVKIEKKNNLDILTLEYELLIKLSTEESIVEINLVYENTINFIKNSLTIEDVKSNTNYGISQMRIACIIDQNKINLDSYKISTTTKMYNFINFLNVFIESYHIGKLNELVSKYVDVIDNCLTIEEVDVTYESWYEDLLNIVVDIKVNNYLSWRDYIFSEFNDAIEFIETNYLETQAEYLIELQNTLLFLKNNYHIVKMVKLILIENYAPSLYISQINNNYFESIYEQYYEIVNETSKIELEYQYNTVYKVLFNEASDYQAEYQIILNFITYVESLPTT